MDRLNKRAVLEMVAFFAILALAACADSLGELILPPM